MGALLKRTAELIDLYHPWVGQEQDDEEQDDEEQDDEYKRIKLELDELRDVKFKNGKKLLDGFEPVLRRIARQESPTDYSGTELAVIVVGLIAGTVGNIQASVSIAINQFFSTFGAGTDSVPYKAATEALKADAGDPGAYDKLEALIWEALRLNPPAAFLPRRIVKDLTLGNLDILKGSVVLLAMEPLRATWAANLPRFRMTSGRTEIRGSAGFRRPPGSDGYLHHASASISRCP